MNGNLTFYTTDMLRDFPRLPFFPNLVLSVRPFFFLIARRGYGLSLPSRMVSKGSSSEFIGYVSWFDVGSMRETMQRDVNTKKLAGGWFESPTALYLSTESDRNLSLSHDPELRTLPCPR